MASQQMALCVDHNLPVPLVLMKISQLVRIIYFASKSRSGTFLGDLQIRRPIWRFGKLWESGAGFETLDDW